MSMTQAEIRKTNLRGGKPRAWSTDRTPKGWVLVLGATEGDTIDILVALCTPYGWRTNAPMWVFRS